MDGTLVIPSPIIAIATNNSSSITDFAFNKSFIIAKTKDENKVIKYWFLEKSTHLRGEPLQPMDSVQFYRVLSAKNITLTFED